MLYEGGTFYVRLHVEMMIAMIRVKMAVCGGYVHKYRGNASSAICVLIKWKIFLCWRVKSVDYSVSWQ